MPLILTPTLEVEIAAKRAEISAEEFHTSRTEYIAIVAPLQAQLQDLIEQNEAIIAANVVLTAEYVPPLAEYKIIAQDAFKAEAKEHINSAYSPEIQRSAALHVYPFDTEMTISEFVSQCVAEENRCYDAVEAATSIEEVDAVTATWTEVV